MNKVFLIGNLCADPETKFLESGKQVTNMRVATNDGWGENKRTNFHRITVWGKSAASCADYLSKGAQAAIDGRIEYRKYTDSNGTERWSTDIVADRVEFLGKASSSASGSSSNSADAHGGDDVPF